ncbi:uncharacterized protein LOC118343993 isoform X2 [Juglans regia]|uniref:Uncharacterized protein LOC118343993 isoform X2 n=1 Tax=Juglans regia TaxID=51240 RepID=A0A6P9DWG4_JUGRE|nr:uncharacterized protein LOC118343993 isoform X2 [Juglans regia]
MTETRIRASEGSTWCGPTPQSQPCRWTRMVEQNSSLDDSTQPSEMVLGTEFPEISNDPNTRPENNGKLPMRRCHGRAGCTEFMKLRKHGLIPLKINDGERAPSCENAVFFTTRVTWIIKHHATMAQNTWDAVDTQEKEEQINRVRADFILDWSKRNHREMVEKNLGKKFNDFHYQLHKIYLGCATHDEALVKPTSLVEPDEAMMYKTELDDLKREVLQDFDVSCTCWMLLGGIIKSPGLQYFGGITLLKLMRKLCRYQQLLQAHQ